jgi:hypothetical protein
VERRLAVPEESNYVVAYSQREEEGKERINLLKRAETRKEVIALYDPACFGLDIRHLLFSYQEIVLRGRRLMSNDDTKRRYKDASQD